MKTICSFISLVLFGTVVYLIGIAFANAQTHTSRHTIGNKVYVTQCSFTRYTTNCNSWTESRPKPNLELKSHYSFQPQSKWRSTGCYNKLVDSGAAVEYIKVCPNLTSEISERLESREESQEKLEELISNFYEEDN